MSTTQAKNTMDRVAQNPLILRCHRLMEAFAKSDDERDFYVDRLEGFIVYVDLDKPHEDLAALERALKDQPDRFCLIPKLTFYETKKIMEGFVNEKVYDIDTKERLLDIIGAKAARDNFLEFIYDHHAEQEKWQQYYQERSRIRIIEWLRKHHFQFVFEEDLDFTHVLLDKIKTNLFEKRVGKDIENARKVLLNKAKTYYSNEALNPRPKRGRPPKAVAKLEVEPKVSADIYTAVPNGVRPFLFTPDTGHAWTATFSSKFETEELMAGRKSDHKTELNVSLENLNKKLESLRQISNKLVAKGIVPAGELGISLDDDDDEDDDFGDDDEDDEDSDFDDKVKSKAVGKAKKDPAPAPTPAAKSKAKSVKSAPAKPAAKKPPAKKAAPVKAKAAPKAAAKAPAAKKAKAPAAKPKPKPKSSR